MRPRSVFTGLILILCAWGVLLAAGGRELDLPDAPKPFKRYPGQNNPPLPPDYQEQHEWTSARLMYRNWQTGGYRGGSFGGYGAWAIDYPEGDQNLIVGVRRLTSIDARSVEQVTQLDGTRDIYNWPFLYAVEVGQWELDGEEGKQLRDYLDRGGFLMVDDFHGRAQWQDFEAGIREAFPTEAIEDLPQEEPIFHMLGDVDQRVQVPGELALSYGRTYEQPDDPLPHWRGIRDKKGRIVVAICYNMDLGDAWEFSNEPWYPADFATTAHKILVNYATYNLTH